MTTENTKKGIERRSRALAEIRNWPDSPTKIRRIAELEASLAQEEGYVPEVKSEPEEDGESEEES